MTTPFLSLHKLSIDPEWAVKLPSYLARYHLILPIAAEAEGVTLAMAHPDNPKLLAVLEGILGHHIVPVRADPQEIRYYLDQFYPPANGRIAQHIAYATQEAPALDYLSGLSAAIETPLQAQADTAALLAQDQVRLISLDWPGEQAAFSLENLLQHPASLLLCRGHYPPPRHLLIASQGHSPDHKAIQVGMQIAKHFGAPLSLLGVAAPMKRQQVQGIGALLDSQNKAGQHFQRCCQQIEVGSLEAYVKLRQGIPEEQIAAEFWEGAYDLLLIPVETYGRFVARVMAKIEALAQNQPIPPILAIKPSW